MSILFYNVMQELKWMVVWLRDERCWGRNSRQSGLCRGLPGKFTVDFYKSATSCVQKHPSYCMKEGGLVAVYILGYHFSRSLSLVCVCVCVSSSLTDRLLNGDLVWVSVFLTKGYNFITHAHVHTHTPNIRVCVCVWPTYTRAILVKRWIFDFAVWKPIID